MAVMIGSLRAQGSKSATEIVSTGCPSRTSGTDSIGPKSWCWRLVGCGSGSVARRHREDTAPAAVREASPLPDLWGRFDNPAPGTHMGSRLQAI
jgi:hypothetical protein